MTSSWSSLRPQALALTLALTAASLAGCASSFGAFNDIPPADVSTEHYKGLTCDQMRAMAQSLSAHKANLVPALFSSISQEERQKQLAQVNGELNALSQVSSEKCGTPR